jgi:hypothetical protein
VAHRFGSHVEGEVNRPALLTGAQIPYQVEPRETRLVALLQHGHFPLKLDPDSLQEVQRRRPAERVDDAVESLRRVLGLLKDRVRASCERSTRHGLFILRHHSQPRRGRHKSYAAPAGALLKSLALSHDWRRRLLICRHSLTEDRPAPHGWPNLERYSTELMNGWPPWREASSASGSRRRYPK